MQVNIKTCEVKKTLDNGRKIYKLIIDPVVVDSRTVVECESFSEFQPGPAEVNIFYDSQYNRHSIKSSSTGSKGNGGGGWKGGATPEERQAEREQIARNSGLKHAIDLFNGGKTSTTGKPTEIILPVAKVFSEFILTGNVPAAKPQQQ